MLKSAAAAGPPPPCPLHSLGAVMGELADRRFVGLLEAAPDAMLCVEADGRIALVNAQAERLFGYRREELVGQPVEALVPDAVRGVHPGHRAGYVADPRPRPPITLDYANSH